MNKELKIKEFQVEELKVDVFSTREILGSIAAKDVASKINEIISKKNKVRMIFAAAPSQNELLSELIKYSNIDWTKITAFHMDEYIGLERHATQAFGKYLGDRIFNLVPFKKVHYINSNANQVLNTCNEYSNLLSEEPIDIVCMGIGENGHIAFNDPPYADFNDLELVKIVQLDEVSRQQQVNDGCFSNLSTVPKEAITLTIPALISAEYLFIVAPGKSKANAIKKTLEGEVTENCPATILRKHKNAKLYLDKDSASSLSKEN